MIEALQYGFIQRSLFAGLILGLTAPLIGSFLVIRRYSLMADSLAHVSLLGVALGLLLEVNPLAAALLTALIAAWAIESMVEKRLGEADNILAIFLWGGLAGAAVVISLAGGFQASLFSYLFGDISGVQPEEVWIIALLGGLIVLVFLAFNKKFFALAVDPELARASGINGAFYNRLLVLMAAVTVALAARILGVLLIGALMVIPFSAARNWGRGFGFSLGLALVISVISVLTGLMISYQFNLAPGGAIVLCALFFYGISSLAAKT